MVGVDVRDHHALHVGHLEAALAQPARSARRTRRRCSSPRRRGTVPGRSRTRTRTRSAAGSAAGPGCSTVRAAPARRAAAAWWQGAVDVIGRECQTAVRCRPIRRGPTGRGSARMRGLTDKVVVVAGGGSGIGAATARRLGDGGRGGGGRRPRRRRAPRRSPPRCATPGAARSACSSTSPTTTRSPRWSPPRSQRVRRGRPPARQRRRPVAGEHRPRFGRGRPCRSTCSTAPLEVNLRGHLLCTRHVLPRLLARGGWRDRLHQLGGGPHRRAGASVVRRLKAGINAIVRHVASRLGPRGDPGQRGGARDWSSRRRWPRPCRRVHASTRSASGARPRLGRPDDIAAMVAYLMSDDGEWVNGQVLSVDGGASLRRKSRAP